MHSIDLLFTAVLTTEQHIQSSPSFVPRMVTGAEESERIILIRLDPWY